MNSEKKNLKILLLGASFQTNNMGVGALTAGSLKILLRTFKNAEVVLLDYSKSEAQDYQIHNGTRLSSIKLANLRFSKKIYLRNNIAHLLFVATLLRLLPFHWLKNKISYIYPRLKEIQEADMALSLAGGDSFSDIYGIGRFLYVSLPQILTLLLGKRLVFLPQTLGPFKGRLSRILAKYIISRAELIYTRDYISQEEVITLFRNDNIKRKLRFNYDVGFVLEPQKPENLEEEEFFKKQGKMPLVGLNVSGLLYIGGYTQDDMFGLGIDYPAFVRKLIDHFITQHKVAVLLIPHHFGEENGTDSRACMEIYDELNGRYGEKLFSIRRYYNQNEIKYIIGCCDFFIGSRMHACIAAISQNIPSVSIAYSRKFIGVMEALGVESLVVDPRKMTKNEILDIIDRAYKHRYLIQRELKQKIPYIKEKVYTLFNGISLTS